MHLSLIGTLSANSVVAISRKVEHGVGKSTVHVFVPATLRAATDILIASSKGECASIIEQSGDINDGVLHNVVHEFADETLKTKGATEKYSGETHCHISCLTDGGAGYISSVLLSNKVIDINAATIMFYKLTTTKFSKEDERRNAQAEAARDRKPQLLAALKMWAKASTRTKVGPDFFDQFF
ncbi:hypothetical protein EPZ47_18700 [Pseudomonas viciae]|uniref:Uncharacterized protein n=1 Tax=Pseudomonas viciae TaxID=2505979 RepID=A0A4P7PIP8_9PSED|nr:hypothetical protein [Pseudomonas viciae]QBZ90658.1 hypothetical protein EPZ47_18700 [Pseudomonas viciae]